MPRNKTTGIYQQKDGTWCIDTKVKVNGEFKHLKRNGYATLGSAKAELEKVKEDFIRERSFRTTNEYFEDLIREYLKVRKVLVDESTIDGDLSTFNVYFKPYFSGKKIRDVFNEEVIYEWYHNLVDTPKFTNNKKSKVITRMKDLLLFAYKHKYIGAEAYQDCDVNIYQVKYSKKAEIERVVWSEDEERAFLRAVEGDKKDGIMFKLFLATSPRLGEFLGLQPSCFDREKNRIVIHQQVKNVRGKGAILTDKLKTHESYRSVAIPEHLSKELQDYIDDFGIKDNQFLWFFNDKNYPLSRNSIRRLFNKYCELAGVRKMNLHALRHNQAVKLASVCKNGEEIEVAARRLGHSPSMFLNTYANHTNDKKENELLSRLGDA